MRSLLLQFVINIILLGLVTRYWRAHGFGFPGFAPSAVPLPVAASFPSPFPFPSSFAPIFPSQVLVLAPSYAPVPFNFLPSPYPAFGGPPFGGPPFGVPSYAPYPPHLGLASILLNAILAKKGKFLPPPPYPYPPPPGLPSVPLPHPPQFPKAAPQEHLLNVHITKDHGDEKKHHHHWQEDTPKWD